MKSIFDPKQARGEGSQLLQYQGRAGVVLDSLHGSICIGDNPVQNADRGSLALWVLPFEDLQPTPHWPSHNRRNPNSQDVVLISDHPVRRDGDAATFAIIHNSDWHPGMSAKFYKGNVHTGFMKGVEKLSATTGYTHLRALRWSQIVLTWNKPEHRAALYVNGVRQGCSDTQPSAETGKPKLSVAEMPGPFLYTGGTLWATGDIEFSDQELGAETIQQHFFNNAVEVDEEEQAELKKRYLGQNLDVMPSAGDGWQKQLELSLCDSADLLEFHPQGCVEAARITSEGLRITTRQVDSAHDFTIQDYSHVYLWSRKFFHGAMRVRFDFKVKKRGGLSLLMTQCAGMQGEDHLSDFPRDTNGTMQTVCWQDVRNYHWEYYREMNDVRNDVASHAMLKNPFFKPVDFRVQGPLFEIDRWYSLEFRQDGTRILGAVDDVLVIDGIDDPADGHGPLLSQGRIALRCMCRTDMVFRNLTVETRPRFDGTDLSWNGI